MFNTNNLPASVKAEIDRARRAPTFGEASHIFCNAFRNAGLPMPVAIK